MARSPFRITDGLHQVSANGARVTIVETDDGVVVVDAGARGSLRRIASGFNSLGLSIDDVVLVTLTHYHPDHFGGLRELADATSAKVAVHTLEADVVSGKVEPPSPYRNGLVARVGTPIIKRFYGDPVAVDVMLNDGDRLPIAEEIRVVHVPGHTLGSICFLVPSRGALIVGDSLQYRRKRLGPPARAVTADFDEALKSIAKLQKLEFETVCFSHFDPLREGAKEAVRKLAERYVPESTT